MPELHGQSSWPGVRGVKKVDYTISHGIAPAAARLSIWPQFGQVAMAGDLVMSDGVNPPIVIPRCRVDASQTERDTRGRTVTLFVLDRRWRWKELGSISGTYNQVDSDGLIYPAYKRTPHQLMELCLRAMGEVNYQIILPPVEVWPAVNWRDVVPAQALEALATSLGCRVCYRLDTDSVLICPLGVGAELPDGHMSEQSLALDLPERPDRIRAVGQPIRYQARFKLSPRGREWNDEVSPLGELSYRPVINPAIHKVKVTPGAGLGGIVGGDTFTLRLDNIDYSFTYQAGADPVAVVVAGLKAAIDLTPQFNWRAFDETTHLTVLGGGDGTPFDVVASADGTTPTLTWELLTQGVPADVDPWSQCPVHTFASVRGTDRMTKERAIAYAKESVYRWYEITLENPEIGGVGPVRIPTFNGLLVRKEQIVLQQTRAEQIKPAVIEEPIDEQGRPRLLLDDQGRPRMEAFYDGHNRDKPAACYGSYFIGTIDRTNTEETSEVTVPFSIDVARQLVIFQQPVYYLGRGAIYPADLVLETACNLRDAETNAFICVESVRAFPEPHFGTQPLTLVREDALATVLGLYDARHRLVGANGEGVVEALQKLNYYLTAYAAQYEITAAQGRTYTGLRGIWLDGAIQQVTWSVGSGSTTRVSRNSEHSRYIPPFPVRQKNVVLDPVVRGKRGPNPPFQGLEGAGGGPGGLVQPWLPPPSQAMTERR